MIQRLWTGRSLRYWIAVGMSLALVPVALSAVAGYFLLDRGVIASFHHVAARQRDEVVPAQRLSGLLWETLVPVDEFVDEGGLHRSLAYRGMRERIEAAFAVLHARAADDLEVLSLAERARDDWTAADGLATELISVERAPGDPQAAELMERFHGTIAKTADKLAAVNGWLAAEVQKDHDAAVHAYDRAALLAGFAGIVCVLTMISGVLVIGRILKSSVDRLVDGAARFAEGDRDHRIDVTVPPELRKVADEFNRMIRRIQESESALADLARRDGLTKLRNRRAFDEELAESFARLRRQGEPFSLLALDIDHFKRVNDTHGHSAGDQVLRELAQTATSGLRPFDLVFRTGGEEFSVILPGTDAASAHEAAERLREAIAARPVAADGAQIPVTVSVGLAEAVDGMDPKELVEAADAALYRAKAEGRNRVVASPGGARPDEPWASVRALAARGR
ncbi:MAG: diguanylate cyclase [Alphaproteobacteria bacterium]|nr:diguanylate cyclase [Alphaproteobacteria bacterium]